MTMTTSLAPDGGGSDDGSGSDGEPSSVSSLTDEHRYSPSESESETSIQIRVDLIGDGDCGNDDDDDDDVGRIGGSVVDGGGGNGGRKRGPPSLGGGRRARSSPPPPMPTPMPLARSCNPRPLAPSPPTSTRRRSRASVSSSSASRSLLEILLGRPPTSSGALLEERRPPSDIYLPADRSTPSARDEERMAMVRDEMSSLQDRGEELRSSLDGFDRQTKANVSDLLLALMSCGGDAKNEAFVEAVAALEKSRTKRAELERNLQEVARALTLRTSQLEALCGMGANYVSHPPHYPLPIPCSTRPMSLPRRGHSLEGRWFTLTKPTYFNCLGFNDDGNPMYTLGRMSFEMFRPSDLVVSIEAVFNPIEYVAKGGGDAPVSVPKALREEVDVIMAGEGSGDGAGLMTYHIVTAFVIEPYSPSFGPSSPNVVVREPIRGIMTTYGYALPDPDEPDRLSVWFAGGKVECGEPRRSRLFRTWKRIFSHGVDTDAADRGGAGGSSTDVAKPPKKPPRRTFREGMMVAAARLLMGAEGYDDGMDDATGVARYRFARPMGGHGKAYVDVLHLDEQTRVMRGHAGTIYVFTRIGK